MWNLMAPLSKLKDAVVAACALIEEPGNGEWKKEKVLEIAHQLWEEIDPTPDLELDDTVVEMILDWLVETVVEKLNLNVSTANSNLS